MDVTNLQVGMIAHLQWKSKLADFFYGVEELTLSDVPDHTSCDFGKLFYSTVLDEFSDFEEINLLERLHKEVHDDIKTLIQMPEAERRGPAGKQALEEFKKKSDSLVEIMEHLEVQVRNRAQH
ncbi:MAG: CZB domain-containing protein [Candidatus Electrothrix aestuarii]|jgi:methyl-accepting chemotaxis protein|uniref:CZB domain-containing protein n=1 Tax=Candidatus Electrothrix aestuarii TaxID=3062594 RepID=A0AAU8LSW4_9BACT|nr:CZB domain-containing protein [Candidatus Electrothrix aestuarii]